MNDKTTGESGFGVGITIRSVGMRWYHPGGFVIDRPNGHQDWTFIQWLTPTILKIDGKTRVETPGGCIFYAPGQVQWYGSDVFTPFGNNWLHFNGPAVSTAFMDLGIPLNQALRPKNDDFIDQFFRIFMRESMSTQPGRHQAQSAQVMLFLVEFGRILQKSRERTQSVRNIELKEKFEKFRERLRELCIEPWTVSKMAQELHLSPSRFSNLYREFFDAKPVDDLIRMRLDLAGYYLSTTTQPINYVAGLCGFTDIYYFSRLFKAKMGLTPTAFRTEAEKEGISLHSCD